MKTLNIILGLFLVLLMVPIVLAVNEFGNVITGGKLLITDMDVKVGSKTDKNMDFGDKIKEEARPGSVVKFMIEGENNFTDAEDLEIEDIEVTVTIEEIDDGDELEEEGELKDLKDGKNDDVTIEFTIPLEVEGGDYDVLIVLEGEDENGTITHEVQYELELEVEKEDNEVRFLRNVLTPSEIKCGRTVQLSTAVINTGADEEDDVVLEITNVELGISIRETFDLSNDAFDDDSKFRKTFTLAIPEDVESGIYTIPSKVIFEEGDSTETETAELIVAQCEILEEEEEEEEEEEVVVVRPEVTEPTDVITAGVVTTPTLPVTEEKPLFQTSGFLVALIVGEVLLLIVAILIVVGLVKKRSQ
jgi:predicted nucleotidyltransferase|tara:strand:- start:942 stop:2021 length:1080 start_codon:yes stop_codon:yes gene_type:complete